MKTATLFALLLPGILSSASAQTTQRNSLVEDFSNEECHPCHTMSLQMHPAILSLNANDTQAHLNVIAYQMNFPGNDPSYNAHAEQRFDFYNLAGLPAGRLNGTRGLNQMFTQQQFYNFFDTSRNTPATLKISGSYAINTVTKQITAAITATSLIAMQGPYRVYTAIAERHYVNNASSIGMYDYYFVMRRMLPDGKGRIETNWTANVPKSFQYTTAYQVTNPPAMGSFDFWGNPLMSDLVVFVQDTVTKRVLQSQVIKPAATTALDDAYPARTNVLLHPNPARNHVSVAFELESVRDVALHITDVAGRTMHSQQAPSLAAGRTAMNISTESFAPGFYTLRLVVGGEVATRSFVVAR